MWLVRLVKDRNGNVLTHEESMMGRLKEYFEKLMNKENDKKEDERSKKWWTRR